MLTINFYVMVCEMISIYFHMLEFDRKVDLNVKVKGSVNKVCKMLHDICFY